MRILTIGLALCATACAPMTTSTSTQGERSAAVADYRVFGPGDFQSFVKNWDGNAPLCVRIRTAAEWDRYFGAAAVMGGDKPFGPPPELWNTHTAFLLAREANGGGDVGDRLKLQTVQRGAGGLRIDTAFDRGTGSHQVTTYVLVAIPRPVTGTVTFTDRGQPVCSVRA